MTQTIAQHASIQKHRATRNGTTAGNSTRNEETATETTAQAAATGSPPTVQGAATRVAVQSIALVLVGFLWGW